MTGADVVEQALVLLNYTTPIGETDNALNAEQIRRALPALNQVMADLVRIKDPDKPFERLTSIDDELPLDDGTVILVAVPGVAMYLAHGENDADNYNRFSNEYYQRRNHVHRNNVKRKDYLPNVCW